MGIQGLLGLLKSIQKPCHIKKFEGLTLGVDAYVWLHRGTISCTAALALGQPTTKFVEFVMHRVRMLIHFGITPYLVFDGDRLPSKAGTEEARAKRRAESKKVGMELYRMGKMSQAFQELQKAIDVTPEMACQLIEELKRHKIEYVVAPYEADAQLAYLEKKGIIDGVISEDSDLLVFGVQRLITKLDQYGECIELNRKDFSACREVSFVNWSDTEFRQMAILSGCDYLPNIPKMGLKTAHQHLSKYRKIERVIQILQLSPQWQVPTSYPEDFRKAEQTFLHQRVFCPAARDVIMLNDIEAEPDDFGFVGRPIQRSIAIGIAKGIIHPMTHKPIALRHAPVLPSTPSPWLQRSASDSKLLSDKSSKSIETFFKPRRIPLAELDPNSFTPSPSQRRLLDTQPSSISSTSVGIANSSRRATSGPAALQGRVLRDQQSDPSAEQSTSKRPRLCQDDDQRAKGPSRQEAPMTEKSRFFASAPEQPSPCVARKPVRKAAPDVQIWSDDSVDGILRDFDDPNKSGQSTSPRFPVFADGKPEKNLDTPTSRPRQVEPHKDKTLQQFLRESSVSPVNKNKTMQRFLNGSASSSPASLLSKSLPKANADLQPESTGPIDAGNPEETVPPGRRASDASDVPAALDEPAKQDERGDVERLVQCKVSPDRRSLTQFSSTLRRSQSVDDVPQSPLPHQKESTDDISEDKQKPAAQGTGASALRGSEEMLIPDSEDDGEEEEGTTPQSKPWLNFSSFLYKA